MKCRDAFAGSRPPRKAIDIFKIGKVYSLVYTLTPNVFLRQITYKNTTLSYEVIVTERQWNGSCWLSISQENATDGQTCTDPQGVRYSFRNIYQRCLVNRKLAEIRT